MEHEKTKLTNNWPPQKKVTQAIILLKNEFGTQGRYIKFTVTGFIPCVAILFQ